DALPKDDVRVFGFDDLGHFRSPWYGKALPSKALYRRRPDEKSRRRSDQLPGPALGRLDDAWAFLVLVGAVAAVAEGRGQGGHEEEVEDGGGDETAEDHHGHRVLDLVAGLVAGEGERDEGEAGGERGHEDRREALLGAAEDEVQAEGLALLLLEMAVVADQH